MADAPPVEHRPGAREAGAAPNATILFFQSVDMYGSRAFAKEPQTLDHSIPQIRAHLFSRTTEKSAKNQRAPARIYDGQIVQKTNGHAYVLRCSVRNTVPG